MILAVLLAQVASSWWPRVSIPPPAAARAAVLACGLAPAEVRIAEDAGLQEQVIRIRRLAPTTDRTLSCVATASLRVSYDVQFGRPSDQRRYDTIYYALQDERSRRDARKALAEHRLLARLPRYDPRRESLLAYAGDLEALCGVGRGRLLVAATPSLLTFDPKTLPGITADQLGCVMAAAAASNLKEQGAGLGFIGNAAPARLNR